MRVEPCRVHVSFSSAWTPNTVNRLHGVLQWFRDTGFQTCTFPGIKKKKTYGLLGCTNVLSLYLAKQTTPLVTILDNFKKYEGYYFSKRGRPFQEWADDLAVCLCIAQYIVAERPSMCKGSVVEWVVLGQAECLEESQVEPCRPQSGVGGVWTYCRLNGKSLNMVGKCFMF